MSSSIAPVGGVARGVHRAGEQHAVARAYPHDLLAGAGDAETYLRHQSTSSACRSAWQQMHTAAGSMAICVGAASTMTARAVVAPAEALRAYAEGVYLLKELALHRGVVCVRVRAPQGPEQRAAGEARDGVEAAAYADAHDYGRAGVAACGADRIEHEFAHARPRPRRG